MADNRTNKAVLYVGVAGFLIALATIVGLSAYFASFPMKPDVAQNLIVPWNLHGANHYIAAEDDSIFRWVSIVCGGMFVVVLVGAYITRER